MGMILENGYEMKTTFYEDFTIADAFGSSAVNDTYKNAFLSWKHDHIYMTELSMVLNWKVFEFYNTGISNIPGATIPLVNWSVKNLYNGFLLLPILSAVSQIAMTKLMGGNQAQPADGAGAGTGKFMQWFFPLFSMWICLGYSAAFALYWVAGNLVSMGQTFAINKYLDRKEQLAAPVAGEGSVK